MTRTCRQVPPTISFCLQAAGITYANSVFVCVNDGAIVWLAISYAYKGLLQLVAVLMAFHTRNVRIKALNDSTEIAAIIYINSITLALLTVVEFALSNYHEVHAGMFGLALLVGATLFLSLVFVPRVRSYYRTGSVGNIVLVSFFLSFFVSHNFTVTVVVLFCSWYIFIRILKVRQF